MKRLMTYLKTRKGIALVYVALMLAVLLMLAGVAIDLAYMYNVKNQLQVASDSAALAGAGTLYDANMNYTPLLARQQAWEFACKNTAARSEKVFLVSSAQNCADPNVSGECCADLKNVPVDLNNGNNPRGDIVLGNWNKLRTAGTRPCDDQRFLPTVLCDLTEVPLPAGATINAAKTVARRTGSDAVEGVRMGNNSVRVFLGQIFKVMGGNWSQMDANAVAVAARPPRATGYFALCWDSSISPNQGACMDHSSGALCTVESPCVFSSPKSLCPSAPGPYYDQAMGWTTLLNDPSSVGGASGFDALLCGDQPFQDVCGHNIWLTAGGTSSFKNVESLMYNPLYDSSNKTCATADLKCRSSSDIVTGWSLIAPVTETCPPGASGGGGGPATPAIYGYAKIHLTAACGSGGGGPTACTMDQAPAGVCTNDATCHNNYISIDSISCIDCEHADELVGGKSLLVK